VSTSKSAATSKPASKAKRKTYNHGDLRAALLDAADGLLDEGGVEAVSLREVARRTGVTATATYRHFSDKESLLAALALRGFQAFGMALQKGAAKSDNPLASMGQTYVRFALARPGRFRLMFGPAVADRDRHPELKAAVEAVTQGFGQAIQSRSDLDAAPAVTALRLWSMIHGLCHLLLDGMLPGYDPDDLARAITSKPSK
jgi:AcrR family transcriptional regulator